MTNLHVVPKTKKQEAREQRMRKGCCPRHGIEMVVSDGWYFEDGEPADCDCPHCQHHQDMGTFAILECPRRDCGIKIKVFDDLQHTPPQVVDEEPPREPLIAVG